MKKREFNIIRFISISMFVMWLAFYLNKDFVVNSDLRLHYEFALELPKLFEMGIRKFSQEVRYSHILSYPGWHIIFLIIYSICNSICRLLKLPINSETCSIVAQAIENSMLVIVSFYIILSVYKKYFKMSKKWACLFSLAMMYVGPLYLPVINSKYYLGQFTANPLHNPTTLAVKPFAIGIFFFYCWILDEHNKVMYSGQVHKKQIICENVSLAVFGMSLLVSAWLKPSFYQIYLPALFAFCVLDCIKTRFKKLKFYIKTGIALLPMGIMILVQYVTSFIRTGNNIVVKPFEVWGIFSNNMPGSFILSLAFPILAYLLYRGIRKNFVANTASIFAMLVFASAFGQFILFSFDIGADAGDFIWGVYLATSIIFMIGIGILWEYVKKVGINLKSSVAILMFCLHLICGIVYFGACFLQGSYFI